ncbi:MAG: hypothetical protein H7144_10210 [Burkholderiales bacterium]|nr:hypothetical protein [Phycisphaerae bacterium]
MQKNHFSSITLLSLVVGGAAGSVAHAFENYAPNSFPLSPLVRDEITSPDSIPGKEYVDVSTFGGLGIGNTTTIPGPPPLPNNGQVIVWDGVVGAFGGGVADSKPNAFSPGDFYPGDQFCIDALAAHQDTLFVEVVSNLVPLLVSHTGDGAGGTTPIYYEKAAGPVGAWATDVEVNGHDGVEELDGLEVWGPNGISNAVTDGDTDRYSILGDPSRSGTKYSVYAPGDTPLIASAAIAAAIGLSPGLAPQLDLDALMMFDDGDLTFGEAGEAILFSIRPVGPFDGGEIWMWNPFASTSASFLIHGGHTWDTAFSVSGAFGTGENIDGLEAIPEPTALSFLAIGALALRRRRA